MKKILKYFLPSKEAVFNQEAIMEELPIIAKHLYPKEVMEIHHEFETAADKLLEEAKSIIQEAANELGIYESGINACVNGKSKFSKGFIWKRKENPIEYVQKPKKVYMGKPFQVIQYTLEGLLIKTWISISEASKQTKTSKSSIIRCCKNKQKTANNFIWKYLNN